MALAAGVLLAGCSQGDDLDLPSPSDPFLPADDETVRFLAFGDMGTGDAAQASVAVGMLQVCRDAGCDFVIGCGDVEFVISGAAAQVRDIAGEANPTLYACGSTLGFVWMEVQGEVLTTRFHAADATLLAERVLDREDPSKSSFVEHTRPATCTPA